MADAGIGEQSAIGGFELAKGSKPRLHHIVLEGKLATTGTSYVLVDGDGLTTADAGTAVKTGSEATGSNSFTALCKTGAGYVTFSAPSSGVVTGTWVIGTGAHAASVTAGLPAGDDTLDIIMAKGNAVFAINTTGAGSTYAVSASKHATTPLTVTAATRASPVVITTSAAHGLAAGDLVFMDGGTSGGTTADYRVIYRAASVTSDTITTATNGSGFGTGAFSAGTLRRHMSAGNCAVTSIAGGTVTFVMEAEDEAADALSAGDSYRLTLLAWARGGI